MTTHTVLLVSRRQSLVAGMQCTLDPDRYTLQWAPSTAQAVSMDTHPSLTVLDLPGGSGRRVSQRIKARFDTLLLVLVRDGASPPQLADAWLPYNGAMQNLAAKISALLPTENSLSLVRAAGLTLNTRTRLLEVDGSRHVLSPKLCDLLCLLIRNAGDVVGRERLVQEIWRTDYVENTRMLDGQVSRLRKLVEPNPRCPERILTVWGKGYVLDVEAQS
jgi:DNA-binding response OmpR family regulator